MGERILVAFIPDKRIIENQKRIREVVGLKIKEGSGLNTPHITIIDNTYSDIKEVDKKLKNVVSEISSFSVKIKGLDFFRIKKNLGINLYQEKDSLIYLIEKNSKMYKIRRKILEELSRLRTDEKFNEWNKENPKASRRSLENMRKYGSAFGGKEWKFHSTIGLIPKTNQKNILKKIEELDLSKDFEIKGFALFRRDGGWKLYKKYAFN